MISDHPQYPLVMTNIAIENGPVEIVDLPSKNGDLPVRYVAVYQRVVDILEKLHGKSSKIEALEVI